ncbi:hypothetical protein [Rhodococcus rhodochrous]|uniref:hypothetical protein n=1 Tax=Rhodococcus rhodochrous TaxID=1829 RepID=UPI00167A1937|nr:hypothetical protein [Rhodococcus rhodochrous]
MPSDRFVDQESGLIHSNTGLRRLQAGQHGTGLAYLLRGRCEHSANRGELRRVDARPPDESEAREVARIRFQGVAVTEIA